jgi:Na+-transporting NADH:ubiquinone oxidoreductase subunit F
VDLLTPILVLSSVSLLLGILVILADKFLADYGDCRILINGERELTVRGGVYIHSALSANKIFIPSACGGKATCGLCKGRVVSGADPLLPTEKPFLNREEMANGTRLFCQVKIKRDMEIVIPEAYFLVREFRATVEAIVPLTHDTCIFRFRLENPKEIVFKPGQFVQFRIPGAGEERAYSIASSPNAPNIVELIVRLIPGGLCTTYMFSKLKVGNQVTLTGPYGEFFLRDDTDAPIICVAGGSGSAPIRSIISYLREKNSSRKIISFYGGRTPRDIYFTEEYGELAKEMKDFTHIPAISEPAEGDGWSGEKGLITQVMDRHLKDLDGCEVYMCGPPIMIEFATKLLCERGACPDRIYYDKF